MACEERLELKALQEAADDGGGADFQRLQGRVVKGPVHSNLGAGSRAWGCYGDGLRGDKESKSGKKIRARLRDFAGQPSPDFFAGQGAWTGQGGGVD